MFDVAIVGGGPAGASCAAFCANCWPANTPAGAGEFSARKSLRRLFEPGVLADFAAAPIGGNTFGACRTSVLDRVEFIGIGGRTLAVPLPDWRRSGNRHQAQSLRSNDLESSARTGRDHLRRKHGDGAHCPKRGDTKLDDYGHRQKLSSHECWSPPMVATQPLRVCAICCHESQRSASRCKLTCLCQTSSEIASFFNSFPKDIPGRPRSETAN